MSLEKFRLLLVFFFRVFFGFGVVAGFFKGRGSF